MPARKPAAPKRRVSRAAVEEEEEEEQEQEMPTQKAPAAAAAAQKGEAPSDEEEEEEEEEEEKEEETEKETQAPPSKRGRSSARASTKAATAASQQDDDDEEEDEDEEEEGEEEGGKSAPRRRRKASFARKKNYTAKAPQHATYFCQTQVDTTFAFSQADDGPVVNQRETQASQCEMRPQDEKNFQTLSHDQQKEAVSEAMRYILFKAARREPVHRAKLHDEVVKKYGKALVRPVLKAAAEQLESTFGYTLVAPPAYRFPRDADQETFYLITKFRAPELSKSINAYGKDVGYRGFCMLVMGLVYCSQSKIAERALFKQLSEAQPGLVTQAKVGGGGGGGGGGRGEEGEEMVIMGELDGVGDVGAALERMKKEQYLIREREQQEVGTGGGVRNEFFYRLGQRAFVEVGPRQILKFLAEAQHQEVDGTMMVEIETEEQREQRR